MIELINTPLKSDANLQGYWRLEADGTDSGPNGYTLSGTAPSFAAAVFGNGGDFELGNSNFLAIADASCPNLEIAGSQTWSAWVKPESVSTAGRFTIMSKRDTSNTGKWLRQGSTAEFGFGLVGIAAVNSPEGSAIAGKWYHVCGVYDATNELIKIFVNGVKTETAASGSATDSNANFAIGCEYSGAGDTTAQYYDGIIDDVAVWNRALTDAEIQNLYFGGGAKVVFFN